MTSDLPNLILIRHGETQWNVAGRLQGRQDTPLTANGVRQALAVGLGLSERIAALGQVAFWVSPLGRARQTASILSDIWSVSFERFAHDDALVERAYGVWEGRSRDEIKRDLPDQYHAHTADPLDYAMPQGESRTMLTNRLSTWLSRLDHHQTHVVITHSGCLRALRGIYSGASQETVMAYREPQTASFLLAPGLETQIDVPASILREFGCEGEGRTVWI